MNKPVARSRNCVGVSESGSAFGVQIEQRSKKVFPGDQDFAIGQAKLNGDHSRDIKRTPGGLFREAVRKLGEAESMEGDGFTLTAGELVYSR